jgi:hypothetical protein
MTQQKAIKLRTQDSQRKSLYFSPSSLVAIAVHILVPLIIVSRITGVFLVEKELSRRSMIMTGKVTAYLPNKKFSAKSTQYISLKAYKKLNVASLWTYKLELER